MSATDGKCKMAEYRFTGYADVAPGDTVYLIREALSKHPYRPQIETTKVEQVIFTEKGTKVKLACNAMYQTSIANLGKSFFLNYSEAEEKLKEVQARV